MSKANLVKMSFNKSGKVHEPIQVFYINDTYIVGIYQGNLSEYDLLIKYKQKIDNQYTRLRTPKHVHWAIDMLIKMYEDEVQATEFINFLIEQWRLTNPIQSEKERESALSLGNLLDNHSAELNRWKKLGAKGEYTIRFLVLLAKLLMLQEKSNRSDAYMFKDLLDALKNRKDIFKIISIASHNGRK